MKSNTERIQSESMSLPKSVLILSVVVAVCFLSVACGNSTKAAVSPPPASVTVMEAKAEDVPIYADYAAQTFSRDMVEVRGRVDGYIEKRLFQVGSIVKAGETLY